MDDLAEADKQTQAWLRDLDNFGQPPPQRHLKCDAANGYTTHLNSTPFNDRSLVHSSLGNTQAKFDFVRGDANDPIFVDNMRKFQLSSCHPYASKSHVETTKKIAFVGRIPANLSTNNANRASFDDRKGTKQLMSRDEVSKITNDVRRTNRPLNIPSEPSTDPTHFSVTRAVPSSYHNIPTLSRKISTMEQILPARTGTATPTVDTSVQSVPSDKNGICQARPLGFNGLDSNDNSYKTYSNSFISCDRSKSCINCTNSLEPRLNTNITHKRLPSSSPSNPSCRSSTAASSNSPIERTSKNAPSSTSLEALQSQQRKFERLQEQVEQELAQEQSDYGSCAHCGEKVVGPNEATQASDRLYHTRCFTCFSCGRALRDKRFYEVHGRTYCEEDYLYSGFQHSAERCNVCDHPIMDMLLQAVGKSFHPQCFRCYSCRDCLDGVQFALDGAGNVYCVADYHRLFAPKCASCNESILPATTNGETMRVVAIDRNYHLECYVCEGCGLQLTDEPHSRCFPLDTHLLCQSCHVHWLRTGGAHQTITDL